MTEQHGEPNHTTTAVHPGYPHQTTGFDWIMLAIITSLVMIFAIWSLVLWWMFHGWLGLVVGDGFPIVVASLLYPRHCGEL
jgi:hypothetical protein